MPKYSNRDFFLIRQAFMDCFTDLIGNAEGAVEPNNDHKEFVQNSFCALIHFIASDQRVNDVEEIKDRLTTLLSTGTITKSNQLLNELLYRMADSAEQPFSEIDFRSEVNASQWKVKQVLHLLLIQGLLFREACIIASISEQELMSYYKSGKTLLLKLVRSIVYPRKLNFDRGAIPQGSPVLLQGESEPEPGQYVFSIGSKEVGYSEIEALYRVCFEIALKEQLNTNQLESVWNKTVQSLFAINAFIDELGFNRCFFQQLRYYGYRQAGQSVRLRIKSLAYLFKSFLVLPHVRKGLLFTEVQPDLFMRTIKEFEDFYLFISNNRGLIHVRLHLELLAEIILHFLSCNKKQVTIYYDEIKTLKLPLSILENVST